MLCSCGAQHAEHFTQLAEQDRQQVSAWSHLDGGIQTSILGALVFSPDLEALVDEALAANPQLQQILLTLQIRRLQYQQTRGDRMPDISAGYMVERQEGHDTEFGASITINWELDLWHKLADNIQAADKDLAEQQALYQAARDTLAAEVMKAWLGLTAASNNILIEEQRLATLIKTTKLTANRYGNGLCTLDELDSVRSATAESRATVEEYREEMARQQRALRILLGRSSADDISVPDSYTAVALPLVGFPAQSLQRRPDLKAAYLAIEAATLRTRVAYKELLPSINLQAAIEDIASSPGTALLTDPAWSLLAQLTAPLFQGGTLRAAAEIAELETAGLYQAYRQTLLNAVEEVENAIGKERSLDKQQEYIDVALSSTLNNVNYYQQRYQSGLTDILDLLSIQRQAEDLKIQQNNLTYARLTNRIDLGLALGLGATL